MLRVDERQRRSTGIEPLDNRLDSWGGRAFMSRHERLDPHLASQQAEGSAVDRDRVLGLEVFLDHEKARLFQALCLVTRNQFEAEELRQDAFVSVYERWDRVAEMENPTGISTGRP